MITLTFDSLSGMPELMDAVDGELAMQGWLVLEETGRRSVEKLQSHTNERRPPARRGGAARYAHLGHWADVTGDLASWYFHDVVRNLSGYSELVVGNYDRGGYGRILEDREGFWVIKGIMDPGGLVEQEFRQVVAQTTNWERG